MGRGAAFAVGLVVAGCTIERGEASDFGSGRETDASVGGGSAGGTSADVPDEPDEPGEPDEPDEPDAPTGPGGPDEPDDDPGTSDDGGDAPAPDIPDNPYCSEVVQWAPQWSALELEALVELNARRALGGSCGTAGSFAPAPPLTMRAELRCAGRKHSEDMHTRGYFSHTSPEGLEVSDRVVHAGYEYFSTVGENIAGGQPTGAIVVEQWMASEGHCANLLRSEFTEVGLGYYPGGMHGHLWTAAFGRP